MLQGRLGACAAAGRGRERQLPREEAGSPGVSTLGWGSAMENKLSVTFLFWLSALSCEARHNGLEQATTAQTPENLVPEKAAGVNVDLAVLMQRHHLQELFSRYGENSTLTIEGFRKLLRNMGIEKIKRVSLDHEHHHHHRKHITLGTTLEKPGCPSNESSGRSKDLRKSPTKAVSGVENSKHHQGSMSSKSTTVMIIPSADTPATEVSPLAQHSEPVELEASHPELVGPRPSIVLRSSNTSLLVNGKTNESLSMREPERGSYMYSKVRKPSTQECFNASKLMLSHGINTQAMLTATEFSYLCPAIVNQIDGRYCIIHATSEKAESPPKTYSLQVAWIGGFISISIISFLSLLGVVLVPLMNRVFFKFLLSFLVALAVGTLSGDALLHLLPHSHGNHRHHEKPFMEHSKDPLLRHIVFQSVEESAYLDSTWKGLTALGGLYFMFLAEHLITLIKQFKDKKKKKKHDEDEAEIKKRLSKYDSQLSTNEDKSDADDRPDGYLGADSQDPSSFLSQKPAVQEEEEEEEVMITHSHQEAADHEYASRGCRNKCHSHLHDTLGQSDSHHHHDYHHILHHHHHQNHHPHSHSQRYSREELKDAGIATLAWMVIMGDGLHNFSDGLAIGAAFTEGLSSGLSTSVAVFCHELPHELGDFAVLLKAGMTVKQAVLYNALSAMLAYLGMATGILIGHYADNVSMWIFALTAGLFMYVALVDMVPEMLHNDASDHGCSRWGYFLLQNAGILLGFGIMLLISVFEHKIVFSINL
ncbi:zinc transporter ZIP6 isoform X2 [Sphaerodactylus townsendi]|uniref:zinc transporter ZIP6 isoform X2 n=1 Tax=Sphaerodactylus townsendi TaxID=933632 RepID=UPI0020263981|nr:zinc transporter ZIP6 isoform X2 [Sphaerodactylus townsendi]